MLRFGWSLGNLLGRLKARRGRWRTRLQLRSTCADLEMLESRVLPTGELGIVSGVAFIDGDQGGVNDDGEVAVRGISVTLTGSTTANPAVPVTMTATTDANGVFAFRLVAAGTYQITAGPGLNLLGEAVEIPEFAVDEGATVTKDVPLGGIAPAFISLRQFLTNTTAAAFPFAPAGTTTNQQPTVRQTPEGVETRENADDTSIALRSVFNDPDLTSQIRFKTNQGDINAVLFDGATPLTVDNLYNYIESDRYDNTIFHRLAVNDPNNTPANPNDDVPFVLQGGGYQFNADSSEVVEVDADPAVQNEFSATRSNTLGTIAMAKLGGNPNSATNEFFFNLGDNSANLNNQNGGFTVFGRVLDAADQAVLDAITEIPREDHGSPVDDVPLVDYVGTNFRTNITTNPVQFTTDATADNFVLLQDIEIVTRTRTDALTYSVVSNSNEDLVTATIENGRLILSYTPDAFGTANIVVRATDSFGASVQATFPVTVVKNELPEATVELTSDTNPAAVSSDLTARVSADDSDGDSVLLTYRWIVNGVNVVKTTSDTSDTEDTLSPTEYTPSKGDVVRVEVTPNDGMEDGAMVSDSVTLANSLPVVGAVTLDNPSPLVDDTITATVASVSDDDVGDTVMLTYVWRINNDTIVQTSLPTTDLSDSLDLSTLTGITPAPGDVIAVVVTPNDGTADGAFRFWTTTVANSLPTASVEIANATNLGNPPTATDTLMAVTTNADADGDTVTLSYVWKVNNSEVPGVTGDTFDLSSSPVTVQAGDAVAVEVTPNDGTTNGLTVMDSIMLV